MGEANMMDRVTDGVAGASLTAPFWIINTHDIFVQWVVPILGASWLVMQMYYKIKHERNKE